MFSTIVCIRLFFQNRKFEQFGIHCLEWRPLWLPTHGNGFDSNPLVRLSECHRAEHVRFEMQPGPDRRDVRGDHRLNDLETIRSCNHARVTKSKIDRTTFGVVKAEEDVMNGNAVLEDVRRYLAIASLYRQTAAPRPLQRASLLSQAHQWEHLAIEALEAYFAAGNVARDPEPVGTSHFWMRSEIVTTPA